MKKNTIMLVIAFVTLFVFSCAKDSTYDDGQSIGNGNIVLRVKTKGATTSSTSMTVASPINIYVFDAIGKCAAYQQVASESTSADFKLDAGQYTIYAVAGADGENYNLPTTDNATTEALFSLKTNKSHGDIMCAHGTATLVKGQETELTMTMARKVWMLRSISITDVPEDVVAITTTIKPLYETINMRGEYSGESGSQTITLSQDITTSTTWESQCDLFLMESVGNPAITFNFKTSDGNTRTYTYNSENALVANYKININVKYQKLAEPTLKCLINGVEWSGENTLEFTIDEGELQEDGDNKGNDDTKTEVEDEAPTAGSLYNGCYVLLSEADGTKTKTVLLSPTQKAGLEYTPTDQTSVKSAVDNAIKETSVEGISGWRLPSQDERALITEQYKAIYTYFKDLYSASKYYYEDTDGTIKCSTMTTSLDVTLKSGNNDMFVRPVATVYFTK